jgi:hypothetical protein
VSCPAEYDFRIRTTLGRMVCFFNWFFIREHVNVWSGYVCLRHIDRKDLVLAISLQKLRDSASFQWRQIANHRVIIYNTNQAIAERGSPWKYGVGGFLEWWLDGPQAAFTEEDVPSSESPTKAADFGVPYLPSSRESRDIRDLVQHVLGSKILYVEYSLGRKPDAQSLQCKWEADERCDFKNSQRSSHLQFAALPFPPCTDPRNWNWHQSAQ